MRSGTNAYGVLKTRDSNTCGNCKSFPGYGYYCPIIGRFCDPNNEKPCEFFEKPMGRIATNGDRIREMSNTDLAEMLVYPLKPMNINGNIHYEFTSCLLLGKSYTMREQAVFLTERRLNAPSGSEVCVAKMPKKARCSNGTKRNI